VTPFELAALAVIGVAAGWINTLAGGGSMLTVPALMFFGLPADVANGTSRVAIVAQCAMGVRGYARAGKLEGLRFGRVVGPTLAGSAAGAYLATWLPNAVFRPVLLGTMLVMAVTLIAKPSVLVPDEGTEPRDPTQHPLAWLSLLLAGFYGGFLQAGVGLILLAVLGGMLRYDLVRGNALKLAIVLAFSVVSVAVFVWRDRVQWSPALALVVGNSVGAQLGVRFAVTRGQGAIRKVVFVTVVATCLVLLLR